MPEWPKKAGNIGGAVGDGTLEETELLAPFNLTRELYGLLESIIGDPETPQRWRERIEEGLDHYEQECRRDD